MHSEDSQITVIMNYSFQTELRFYMRFLTRAFAKFSNIHISGVAMKAGSGNLSQF